MKKILPIIFLLLGLAIPQKAKAIPIVDSLGEATPETKFSVFGTAGLAITPDQFVGPQFVLTQPTIITEIGGFMNNCDEIILGEPNCPNRLPFTVQIHSSQNGLPDLFNTIKRFTLSDDNDPLVVSYESVSLNLLLEPGVYFALFAPQGSNAGFLLENASNPPYQGKLATIGGFNFSGSGAFVEQSRASAVRVLGVPSSTSVPEPSTLAMIGTGLIALLANNRSRRKSSEG